MIEKYCQSMISTIIQLPFLKNKTFQKTHLACQVLERNEHDFHLLNDLSGPVFRNETGECLLLNRSSIKMTIQQLILQTIATVSYTDYKLLRS